MLATKFKLPAKQLSSGSFLIASKVQSYFCPRNPQNQGTVFKLSEITKVSPYKRIFVDINN